ncbi:hypothetical protein BKA64DRAFT_331953 [Cadophora sp. MPI-SDFR-AT-0126]|nr:hypothetical protein BKA64DRAFT_331953 [Leotiomycetes sp. MPI-SDFR-AT-0126]
MEAPAEPGLSSPIVPQSAIATFHSVLRKTEQVYARLMELKEKGWNNPKGDEHFKQQRHRADNTKGQDAVTFYRMMQQIGDEMQANTSAFSHVNQAQPEDDIRILDLCMAPGGYTSTALKYSPRAKATGITLPPSQGGHKVILNSPRSTVLYQDITMFAKEFGVDDNEIPAKHPARASFLAEQPFVNQKFDLVICDGQVLRTHKRPEYREANEATRLTCSQLILALQRIRQGGTLIMLLHKIEAWDTMELLYLFSRFSDIELFKPVKKHAIRGTFYLIAKNMQPDAEAANEAVRAWKRAWWNATFGGEEGTGAARMRVDDGYAQSVIDSFGEKFTVLAKPVWSIQADALSRSDFVR